MNRATVFAAAVAAVAASIVTFPALAQTNAEENLEPIGFNGTGANCPYFISVNTLGDSYAGGIRFTADIKNFIAPGARLVLSRWNGAYVYSAALHPIYRNCSGSTEVVNLWSYVYYTVRFNAGRVIVTLREDSPSIRVDYTSTYNNQAIFKLSEIL